MPDSSATPEAYVSRSQGFTLIELLIAVAIIAIIAGIAYPSYNRYIERSLRTDAHAGLLQAASEMERCYSREYSYIDCGLGNTVSPSGHYDLSVSSGGSSDGGYLIVAETTRSDGCSGNITLNARGLRSPEACW